jgi:hypothetical protein
MEIITNELNFIGIASGTDADLALTKNFLETVDEEFIQEHLISAQKKSWQVLRLIQGEIQIGMTEEKARELALKIFQEHGVAKHWHRPHIRFGSGTMLTFKDPLQENYQLQEGDLVSIDLGPIWPGEVSESSLAYEGDVGDSFVMGTNPEAQRCADAARSLFEEVKKAWLEKTLSGQEIYQMLKKRAREMGFELLESVSGHRIGDFPHHKYCKQRLAHVEFSPKSLLWVLEVQIIHPEKKWGAFFEDILI